MADDNNEAAARQRLAQEREATDRSRQQFHDLTRGKPTPTQEENDLAACGQHFHLHEDDGSGPDPHARHMEADKGAPYQTRHMGARPAAPRPPREQ